MFVYLFCAVAIVGAAIHLAVRRASLDRARAVEILLVWSLAVLVGASMLTGALLHLFAPDFTARQIGWATGSPFQFENAIGDLSFGVLGLLCIWLRGRFWLAVVVGSAIQLLGDAYGHVYQLVVNHDQAPDNVGPILYSDALIPVVLIALLVALKTFERQRSRQESTGASRAAQAPVAAN